MQTGQFASAPDAVRLIVAKEGFKGLYVVYNARLSHLRFIISLQSRLCGLCLQTPPWGIP
jgi:hypothetical protein